MMRLLDQIATPGGDNANEDRVGHCGTLAWVIDGATDLYSDAALPAGRDVLWLVDLICERLAEFGSSGYRGPVAPLLGEVAGYIATQQQARGFPPDRLPPACSLAVVADRAGGYEVARVGDATAVITGDEPALLATDFFDRRELAAVASQRAGETGERARSAMLRRREYTMSAGDVESVFSGHPHRQLRPYVRAGAWAGVDRMLLCTDGFARLVTDYALFADWPAAVDAADSNGLAHLETLLREREQHPNGDPPVRFKPADDAAALLLAPGEPAGTTPGPQRGPR